MKKSVFVKVRELFASTHWTKGTMHIRKRGKWAGEYKDVYCMIGGIAHVLALPTNHSEVERYAKKIVANLPDEFITKTVFKEAWGPFVQYMGYGSRKKWVWDKKKTVKHIKSGKWTGSYQGIVIAWNDHTSTRLPEVLSVLDAAAGVKGHEAASNRRDNLRALGSEQPAGSDH